MTISNAKQAEDVVRDVWEGAEVVEAFDATIDGQPGYDIIVWSTEADAENDDGAKALARYSVVRDDAESFAHLVSVLHA